MGRGVAVVCVALSLIAPAQTGILAAGTSCESLARLMVGGATVTSAKQVPAGAFMPPIAAWFARPSRDSAPPAAACCAASIA